MIDIHNHILPSVDDGAEDIDESIKMAKFYLKSGISRIIATPHYIEGAWNSTKVENQKALEKLKISLDENKLDLEIYLGNEIYITMDILNYIEKGIVSTLNDSRYILIEFPMLDIPLYTENIIYKLLLKGYIPIIAHPERCSRIIENPNILYNFLMKGALAQLNLSSLVGGYGVKIKTTAEILLKYRMIHFVSTDIHSKDDNFAEIESSLNILKNIVDGETFNNITYLNPSKVIEDIGIENYNPIKYQKRTKPSIFSLFFKTV
ncbi:MAG: capsular biosynthesis protein [Tissierellia bacterium]|nr:capsular biosynthesis protein [Tissierellia bacterium]